MQVALTCESMMHAQVVRTASTRPSSCRPTCWPMSSLCRWGRGGEEGTGTQVKALWHAGQGIVARRSRHCGTQVKALWHTGQGIVAHRSRHCGTQVKALWRTGQGIVAHRSRHCGTQVKALWRTGQGTMRTHTFMGRILLGQRSHTVGPLMHALVFEVAPLQSVAAWRTHATCACAAYGGPPRCARNVWKGGLAARRGHCNHGGWGSLQPWVRGGLYAGKAALSVPGRRAEQDEDGARKQGRAGF